MNLTWPFGLIEKSWILKKKWILSLSDAFRWTSLTFNETFFEYYFVDVFDKISFL